MERSNTADISLNTDNAAEQTTRWQFPHFAAFARYLLDNKLEEFAADYMASCYELDLPLMKKFSHFPAETLRELNIKGVTDHLNIIATNTMYERVVDALEKWENNEMDYISRDDINLEDITLGMHARKKTFLKYVPGYVADLPAALAVINDIEEMYSRETGMVTPTFARIMKERIEKQAHLVESISHTIPGAVAIYNLQTSTLIYTNGGFMQLLGYQQEELMAMGDKMLETVIHADDMPAVLQGLYDTATLADHEIRTIECRGRKKDGDYVWGRGYVSLFSRTARGEPLEVIAIFVNIEEEKKRNEQLEQVRDMLLEAQELTMMGSFVQDLDGDYTEATPQLLKVYELGDISELGKARESIHPADRERVLQAKQKAWEDEGLMDEEFRYIIGDREKIIWARGQVLWENGRKLLKGTIMDVTEQKHTLLKLQRSEILHKQAQLMSHIGNWTWNLLTDTLEWSDEMYRIHGLPIGSPVSFETLKELIHPDDVTQVRSVIRGSIETREQFDIQYRIITPTKLAKVLHVKGQVLVDEIKDRPYKMLGTMQDVTHEYEVNRQLGESREFANKIADMSPSLIKLFNPRTLQLKFINNSLASLLGYDRDDAMRDGLNFIIDKIHPDDVAAVMEEIQKSLAEADGFSPADGQAEYLTRFNYRMRAANGQYKWFQTIATIFDRDNEGSVQNMLSVSVDMSKQVEAEQLLQMQNLQLRQSNQSLEEFAYITSHDMKEPLRKIATFADRLSSAQAGKLDDESRMYLDKITASVKRMQALIDDLINLSTLSGVKNYGACNLEEVLNDTLSTLEYKIARSHAVIQSGALPIIEADTAQMRQLFQNLLSNALKFSKENRRTEIHISCSRPGTELLKRYMLPVKAEYIRLDFADNGIGFEPQYGEKIFQTFQRLHGRSQYEGNGIGLAICRKVADNHHGVIFATGEEDKGATFTVILPVKHKD